MGETLSRRRLGVHLVGRGLIAAAALTTVPALAQTQSAEDFFKSASLTMYVGSGAGGGYDTIARLVARHMTRFLPGQPGFVIKNMPGAGGIQSTNFFYNAAPKDGSVILAGTNSALALPIYDSPVSHYDPRKFEWIGSTGKQQAICVTWKSGPIKSLDDATKREVPVGATGVSAGPGVYPEILNALFGTKFKVISGYDTGSMRLALEKGEIDGICGLAWQTYKVISSDWIENKKINVIAQMGLENNAELADVPLAVDLLKNPDDKKVLELIVLPQEFGRPFFAPPGTPPDRMAVYRRAFQAMLKDAQFLAEAEQQRIAIEPLDDKQVQALLDRAYAAPKDIHDRAGFFAAKMN
jgi:tripartite-type tricarboxylate transporter receptor subunit TctC